MIDFRVISISFDIFVYDLENAVNSFSEKVRVKTSGFVKTRAGQRFLSLPLLGPIVFLPIQVSAWKSGEIGAYELFSWIVMIVINLSTLVSLCHNGEWRTRLSMIGWVLTMVSIALSGIIVLLN